MIELESYDLTVTQRMATEGEKICSGLEHGVLKWFQRRELEGGQKTKLRGESVVRYFVAEEDYYCRNFVAAHRRS